MKAMLLIFLLSMQTFVLGQATSRRFSLKEAVAEFPRSQLQVTNAGPVSFELAAGQRAAFERLAEIAGLNILFDPDFRPTSNAPVKVAAAGVLEAFDALSLQAGAFVEVLNANTVIVSPDNPTKRRDYESHVLKTFYAPGGFTPQRMTEVVTTLRATLQARYIATSSVANAIVMRDVPSRLALADSTIALLTRVTGGVPVATRGELIPANGPIWTLEGGVVRESRPGRGTLKTNAAGPVSFDLQGDTRAVFMEPARAAGLEILFDRDFRSQDGHRIRIQDVSSLDALDLVALQTRTFWEALDDRTIIVSPDNQTKRRDLESMQVQAFYLPNASPTELIEIVTALRTLLNCRYLALVQAASAIVIRDNPSRMALAGRIIADLRQSKSVTAGAVIPSGSEVNFLLSRRAARKLTAAPSSLQPRVRGPFSFDLNQTARASYEALGAAAGLDIVFDSRFGDGPASPFKIETAEISDALDFLSLQTGNIWLPLDRDSVLVAPDSPAVRADVLPQTMKTINLTSFSTRDITEMVTMLRTMFNVRKVDVIEKSIVLHETPETLAFAERIVAELEKSVAR
jgi:hypothetical protein